MKTRQFLLTLVAILGLSMFYAGPVLAEKDQDHKHEDQKAPATFEDAVKSVRKSADEIKEMIAAKKLTMIHVEAEEIMTAAKSLGKLALAADSGVPKDDVKAINALGKDIDAAADDVHDAADKNDAAATQAAYDKLAMHVEMLEKHVTKK